MSDARMSGWQAGGGRHKNQLGLGADLKQKGTRCSMNDTERAGIGWRKGWVKRKDADKDKEDMLVAWRNGR